MPVVVSLSGVEFLKRHASKASSAGNLDLRIQTQQRSRCITRKSRPAFCASRSDVAEVAILLDAEPATLAPGERLVVPETARVETNVSANCAHIAQQRRGYSCPCFGENGIVLTQKTGVLDLSQRGQRANFGSSLRLPDALEFRNVPDIEHILWLE